eukprot:CAMPEP_0185733536 /NCGR_PEP_ID=MMETSP1171-20130828/19829_1 /TAXON_ID=374046 /ORGANISM="Helicotheca tamensis, Strain CCMP826" /LENGTH=287 /DNA_ID=CAMNT_0028403297 /DNA_START=116 /DNA_END=976 /DNA_ORIENTATION=+
MPSDPKTSSQQENEIEENAKTTDKGQGVITAKKQSSPSAPSSSPKSANKRENSAKSDAKYEDSLQANSKSLPKKPLPFVSDIASKTSSSKKRPVRRFSPINNNDLKNDDPHNIVPRFADNHLVFFPTALGEIRSGEKRSCWMWFILPTAPHIVNGVERGSIMNRRFALRGDEAVDAYLSLKRRYDPYDVNDEDEKEEGREVDLRQNYIDMASAVHKQLERGERMASLFGPIDDVKAVSSFQLFEKAGIRRNDDELSSLCRKVLDLAESNMNSKKKKRKGPMYRYLSE